MGKFNLGFLFASEITATETGIAINKQKILQYLSPILHVFFCLFGFFMLLSFITDMITFWELLLLFNNCRGWHS